ncbi:hypothetical protein M0802_015908, partial [Mischocyttarus mexicanus]
MARRRRRRRNNILKNEVGVSEECTDKSCENDAQNKSEVSKKCAPVPKIYYNSPQLLNAVCVLNYFKTGATYKVVGQSGPDHAPTFTVAVKIDGETYKGEGRTKRMAEHVAAELALKNIVQLRNIPEVHQAINTDKPVVPLKSDFTRNITEKDNHLVNASKQLSQKQTNTNKLSDENPVELINKLYPGAVYKCISENGEIDVKFTISVTINGKTFEGTGRSKKLAK